MWKMLIILILVISLGGLGYVLLKTNEQLQEAGVDTGITISPFSKFGKSFDEENEEEIPEESPFGTPINMLLLGIDRRSRAEDSWRTDIMILLSVNPKTNQVVMASIPRDLWYKGGRLNALFIQSGWEEMQRAVEQVSGLRPERYILTDFKDFSWLVDAMGGVPVNVDTTFTDTSYPVDETKGYQTITFTSGPEKLTGERALIYSRSRKGNNGEGSDWARMKRQHKILVGMLDAVSQPESLFNPMVVEEAFKTVTTGKMDTNLELSDAKYLWDFYKDKDDYKMNSLFLDYDYLYSPPLEEYGGAWVLVPKGSYAPFKKEIDNRLNGVEPTTVSNTSDQTETAL